MYATDVISRVRQSWSEYNYVPIQDPVICEQKTVSRQNYDICLSNGPMACSRLKIVSINRKYHNHKLQTNPWHCEEESHNNHETLERQKKQRKPVLNTASCDEKHSTTAYRGIIMFHNNIKWVNSIQNPGRHTHCWPANAQAVSTNVQLCQSLSCLNTQSMNVDED